MGRQRIKGSYFLSSAEETLRFGAQFASQVLPNEILALRGDLGAGKTTFMQGLLEGFKIQDKAQSPTFTLLQTYAGPFPIHHFDLYRIDSADEFCRLGFDEFLANGNFAAIEWPERIELLIPPNAWLIDLSYAHSGGRHATIKTWSER